MLRLCIHPVMAQGRLCLALLYWFRLVTYYIHRQYQTHVNKPQPPMETRNNAMDNLKIRGGDDDIRERRIIQITMRFN